MSIHGSIIESFQGSVIGGFIGGALKRWFSVMSGTTYFDIPPWTPEAADWVAVLTYEVGEDDLLFERAVITGEDDSGIFNERLLLRGPASNNNPRFSYVDIDGNQQNVTVNIDIQEGDILSLKLAGSALGVMLTANNAESFSAFPADPAKIKFARFGARLNGAAICTGIQSNISLKSLTFLQGGTFVQGDAASVYITTDHDLAEDDTEEFEFIASIEPTVQRLLGGSVTPSALSQSVGGELFWAGSSFKSVEIDGVAYSTGGLIVVGGQRYKVKTVINTPETRESFMAQPTGSNPMGGVIGNYVATVAGGTVEYLINNVIDSEDGTGLAPETNGIGQNLAITPSLPSGITKNPDGSYTADGTQGAVNMEYGNVLGVSPIGTLYRTCMDIIGTPAAGNLSWTTGGGGSTPAITAEGNFVQTLEKTSGTSELNVRVSSAFAGTFKPRAVQLLTNPAKVMNYVSPTNDAVIASIDVLMPVNEDSGLDVIETIEGGAKNGLWAFLPPRIFK